jgi:large subunit ribosomal protein L30
MATKEAKTKNGLVIRLKKGRIAVNPNQRACLKGLGLKKRHQEVALENTPSVRGMVKKVIHLVEIVQDN